MTVFDGPAEAPKLIRQIDRDRFVNHSAATPTSDPTSPPSASQTVEPGRRLGAPFAVLVIGLLWPTQLVNASSVISAYAQADIAQTFHTTKIAWFSVIYALVGTLLLPFAVKLSDMYGKRLVMITLIACGVIGDVICALAPSFGALLAGRAIAAAYVPVAALALAAARDIFPMRRLVLATGIISASLGAIIAICPLIAGWLLDNHGFRGAMWFVAVGTLIGLVLVITLLPETPRYETGSFDWRGGALIGVGMPALMYGVGQASAWGWADPRVLGLLVGGLLVLALFARVERSVAHPLLDLGMLSRRNVATVLGSSSLVQGAALAAASVMTVVIPLYPKIPGVSDGLGWTAFHGAIIGLPAGIVLFGIGITAAATTRRIGARTAWLIGVPIAATGLVLQAFYHHDAEQIILSGIVAAIGTGIVFGCTPLLVIGAVSTKEQAQASGTSLLLVGFTSTLAVQVLFTTLNAKSSVAQGTTFYHDIAYRNGYLVLAAIVLVGLFLSFFIPAQRRSVGAETVPKNMASLEVQKPALM
jgi:MFS family permease